MKREQVLEAILALTAGFCVLHFIFEREWMLYVALGIAVTGLFFSWLASWIATGWFGLAKILGLVNGKILLSIVFFVFLTPIALLMRLFGGGTIIKVKSSKSYYAERNHTYTKADLETPW